MKRVVVVIMVLLALSILAFVYGPRLAGQENWNVVMTVATLLAVLAALFLDDIKGLLHSPKIELRVGDDLLDEGADMDAGPHTDAVPAWWNSRPDHQRRGSRCRKMPPENCLTFKARSYPSRSSCARFAMAFCNGKAASATRCDSIRVNLGFSTLALEVSHQTLMWCYGLTSFPRRTPRQTFLRLAAFFARPGPTR
jgi:hypothetical protein